MWERYIPKRGFWEGDSTEDGGGTMGSDLRKKSIGVRRRNGDGREEELQIDGRV